MLRDFYYLMRMDKPIGSLLLLWPTMWALWLAARGTPNPLILFVFLCGVFLMRSAGCIVNDIFDRNIDGDVARTRERPIAAGRVSVKQAAMLAAGLGLCAFVLVLFCNLLTIKLAIVGALLAVAYPLMKRITHLPQLGLGVAFSWGVPMAFAAVTGAVSSAAWVLFVTSAIWPVIYDTMYAMADREDDIKIGVKSTAILFGNHDIFIIAVLQAIFIFMLGMIGLIFQLRDIYFVCLFIVAAMFVYQLYMIKKREPGRCFQAFLHNNWVGLAIFVGIVLHYSG